ncbi:hypothetical protein TBR22_A30260 [Luteitalea sp. TBR-22]|uniref:PIG-L deacetylase family protein n=1 Tax=Luteitalea sp. TBR-22 TaxID=2802971 RepID=UPI001AF24945|nr:PIG-L family deacetylase [Luteitalea sp. TBR-22]BCS33798.1 hypothetical protein TBR22_A30260 [Luteitalea sp. TBR-22]
MATTRREVLRRAAVAVALPVLGTRAEARPQATPRPRTILAIGAHFDDCEIGAGGLILKAVRRGHRVVVLNLVGDYSTWDVTRGREARIRQRSDEIARSMGVEKRYLSFGYQQVVDDLATIKAIAEVVVDVRPDVTLMNDRDERGRAPADHAVAGIVAEKAVRNAATILGGLTVTYGREMYAYEVDPQRSFPADVFVDVGAEIGDVVEIVNTFRQLNAEAPIAKDAARVDARTTLHPGGRELALTPWGEIKLSTARVRGLQGGVRFAEAYRALDMPAVGRRVLDEIAG